MKGVKSFGVVWVLTKIDEWSGSGKRVISCSYRCFREREREREREILGCEKNCKRERFLFKCIF